MHIGAGLGVRIPDYLEAGFRQIILVEPNPEILPVLQETARAHDTITVLGAAIAPKTGPVTLNVLNFAEQSALRKPTALKSILPGVQVVGQPVVDGLSVAALMATLPEVLASEVNYLVIEAPGEEGPILTALAAGSYLSKFECLEMSFPDLACFEGAANAADITAVLQEHDYLIESVSTDLDPDWPQYQLRLDTVAVQNKVISQKLAELDLSHQQTLKAERAALRQHLADTTAAHEAAHQTALASALAEAEQSHQHTLDAERAALHQQLADATAAHEAAHEAAHQTALAEAAQSHQHTLDAERAALHQQLADATAAHETALAEVERDARLQRSDLAVALRMQALARSDHDDLKSRFQTVVLEKTQLEDLLGKLTQKLGAAAESLRQLPSEADSADAAPKLEKKKPVSRRKKAPS